MPQEAANDRDLVHVLSPRHPGDGVLPFQGFDPFIDDGREREGRRAAGADQAPQRRPEFGALWIVRQSDALAGVRRAAARMIGPIFTAARDDPVNASW